MGHVPRDMCELLSATTVQVQLQEHIASDDELLGLWCSG
jgi:hypothetical protein